MYYWKKHAPVFCVDSFCLFDVTFSSPAPVRSLASRLQLDLAEGSDGGRQSVYGKCFFFSFQFIFYFVLLLYTLANVP